MPYKQTAYICIDAPTKQELSLFREDGESWNTFIQRIIAYLNKEVSKDAENSQE